MTGFRSQKWAVLFAVVATQFAVPFMLSAVGVCLPAIGREYAATAISLSLVESVFLGVNSMLLLPLGRAADICGRGGVFLSGLAVFALASIALTLAPSMAVFLTIRGVQAVGGAMTLATGLALLYDAFPREERGRALGISVGGIFLGISAGPFLGGLIATHFGWRFVFYAGMAPCAGALLVCLRNLDWKLSPKPGQRFDWAGAVSSAAAVALLVIGSAHTDTPFGRWSLACGAVAFCAFVLIELRSPTPLLRMSLFYANRAFSLGMAAMFIVSCAAFGVSFLLSLYLQYGRGMSAAAAGTVLVVQPVIQCLVSPVCGRLADRAPAHLLAGIGALVTAMGLGLAATLDAASGLGTVIAALAVIGVGIGIFSTPSMVVVMSAVDESLYGIASAVSGQARTLGMTACMAVVTMVIAVFVGDAPLGPAVFREYAAAMRVLFAGGAAFGLLGAALAFLAGNRRPGTAAEATPPAAS
uniref:Arabinose efflux permease family protein n=1 Tax=Desulfovibrio sp. U5L TaxID=596152 RepID=I2Q3K3_9BACT